MPYISNKTKTKTFGGKIYAYSETDLFPVDDNLIDAYRIDGYNVKIIEDNDPRSHEYHIYTRKKRKTRCYKK